MWGTLLNRMNVVAVMGGELVTAEASWLEVVKSAAVVEQRDEDCIYPSVIYPAWIDQLNDPNIKVHVIDGDGSAILKPLALSSEDISRSTASEKQALVKELKTILQQSDRLSKQSFLGLLGSYLQSLKAKGGESTPSKRSSGRLRNGVVDAKDEESTLKLLKDFCRQLGHRLITLVLECSVSLSYWAPVQILLERRVVLSNSSPKLVQSLVEEEESLLLCLYITNVPDLTPQDVYALLTFFLDCIPNPSKFFRPVKREWKRAASDEIEKVVRSRSSVQAAPSNSIYHNLEKLSRGRDSSVAPAVGMAMAIDGFSSPELCIHHLVASGPDEDLLCSIVSQLSTAQVLNLTRYLRKWIEKYSSYLENFPAPKHGRLPSFAQVLSWVGVVLESHFTRFVLSADFHVELRSMRDTVNSLVDFGASISPLGGMTEHLRSQSLLPVRKQRGGGASDYVIELLDMS